MAHGVTADEFKRGLSKVPMVTLTFWIVKICATTVGETGGDALSMSLNLGYLLSTFIFLAFFVVVLIWQVALRRHVPLVYWLVVVATTTVGTTTSDFLTRPIGLGYMRASAVLFAGVIAVLAAWRLSAGKIEADRIVGRRDEVFYWLTILVSNTLGTALGDFTADEVGLGLGFQTGALLFAGLLALVAMAHFLKLLPQTILFWAAYVLTRPLGATLGDTLTKPIAHGGLNLDRFAATGVIALAMVAIVALNRRAREPAA